MWVSQERISDKWYVFKVNGQGDIHVEVILKLSPVGWKGANFSKSKERAFQEKGTGSAKVLLLRKVNIPRTKRGRKEWHEI